MSEARWYPTLVTLADDSHILVVGGAPSNGTTEIYDEATDEAALLAESRAFQRTLHEHGWAALLWPKAYGGRSPAHGSGTRQPSRPTQSDSTAVPRCRR